MFCFLTFLKFEQLFHELMNRYQACLYLFDCFSHGDSKYDHEIPHFFGNFVKLLTSSASLACRVESIKQMTSNDDRMMRPGYERDLRTCRRHIRSFLSSSSHNEKVILDVSEFRDDGDFRK